MKKILFLGTGGTIASEMTEDGLMPELSSRQLLEKIPTISAFCDVDCLEVCNLDSTNIGPEHWILMAQAIAAHYDDYDGFVLAHGTDTMAYTAAALSYLIQDSPKPIILTGAQKPIGFESTDSKINLEDSFRCAASDMHGVSLVFNNQVILGTRAKKTHSKSFGAFASINYPILGVVQDGMLVSYIAQDCAQKPRFYDRLNTRVALLKLIPGTDRALLDYLIDRNDALIIESFGVGGLPEAGDFYESLKRGVEKGCILVMTTQVQNEGSNLLVYQVGHSLKSKLGVLEAYDMTSEAVVAKLQWILAQTHDKNEVERLFYTPIAHDILRHS